MRLMTLRMSSRQVLDPPKEDMVDHRLGHRQVSTALLRVSTASRKEAMASSREGTADLPRSSTVSSREAMVSNREVMDSSKADMAAHLNNNSSTVSDLLRRVSRVGMVSSKVDILLKEARAATVLPLHRATSVTQTYRDCESFDRA